MNQVIPYPDGDDPALEPDMQAEYIRANLRVSDVLAMLQDLLFYITDDRSNPLYAIVAFSVAHGTRQETGRRAHLMNDVGDRLEPYIQEAIDMVVTHLLSEEEL